MLTILSGAGLSAGTPTRAPLGNALRDAYFASIIEAAGPGAQWDDLDELRDVDEAWEFGLDRWRLETVVGMVAAAVPERALLPVQLVLRGEPNRSHELAAELLASRMAPVHLTLNFDDFVERAYEASYGDDLESLTPDDSRRLEGLCRADWTTLTRPVIVHLHGRVIPEGGGYDFPGLVATLETIQGPAPRWAVRLLERALTGDVIVTGYRGLDTDIWPALSSLAHEVTAGGDRVWNDVEEHPSEPLVEEDLVGTGFRFTGAGAVSALSRALTGRPEAGGPRGDFDATEVPGLLGLERSEATFLVAWMLEDLGGGFRQKAVDALGDRPPDGCPDHVAWQWWKKMGTARREGGGHLDAIQFFRSARRVAPGRGARALLWVDEAECHRHLLRDERGQPRLDELGPYVACLALARLLGAFTASRRAVRQRVRASEAGLLVRYLDSYPGTSRAVRRVLAAVARWRARAALLGPDPHARMAAHTHLASALAYAHLAGAHVDLARARKLLREIGNLSDFIRHPLAEANVKCAQALVEIAAGDDKRARTLLREAEAQYREAEHASGVLLVQARSAFLTTP